MVTKKQSNSFKDCVYYIHGQGKPIIFIHGFAEDAGIWKYQVEALSEQNMCIVVELPGCGASAMIQDVITIDALAMLVKDILDQESIRQAIVVGHSMGGYIALAMADLFPEYIEKLVLVHTTAAADDELKIANRRKSIQLIRNNGKEVFLKAMVPNLYATTSLQKIDADIQQHLTSALAISSEVLIAYYEAMINRTDRKHVLTRWNKPVLWIIGKEDQAVRYTDALAQTILSAYAEVILWENIGHTSMYENKISLNEKLQSFCK